MTTYDSAFNRPPAPPPLDLVQAFLNSTDLEDGPDEFGTIDSLSAWVGTHLPQVTADVTEDDRLRVIRLREWLRDFVEAGPGSDATGALQQELDALPLTLRLDTGNGSDLVTNRSGIDAVFARVMAAVHHAMVDGRWARLKICRNDVCRWAFYDTSKNRSGAWCSMATCGSQAKARAYRARSRKKEAS